MLQVPSATASSATPAVGSLSGPEKDASSPASQASAASGPARKPRSCVVCRNRKVRCDKQSPCSNCRRAGIACVLPPTDRPPRWARRLERLSKNAASGTTSLQEADPGVDQVMERLRSLEGLVKELRGQLEQANTAASSNAGASHGNSPASSANDQDAGNHTNTSSSPTASGVQSQFGRLVLHDSNRSRYIRSGFWSRVNDELRGLQIDTQSLADDDSDISDEEYSFDTTAPTQELDRSPSERHAFFFRHNLSGSVTDLNEFHPLPSQVPFLINVYAENVNLVVQMVHIPTVTKMVRDMRGNKNATLTPANEALMFAIYYAAITSMEEDDVLNNFGATKTDLNLKYRVGLEHALAKADFLNVPDMTLVQAFAIFLFLVRRHDSPRFTWMMTGLVIRMAQALGLHRDGADLDHLTPYEIEMRRRVWWSLCVLDVRASEDQGTAFTIASGSFNTKHPLNIDDADIEPETQKMPKERDAITDMTFTLSTFQTCDFSRQMMDLESTAGDGSMEAKNNLLSKMYEKVELNFRHALNETGNIGCWVAITCTRLVVSKMTLFLYLPILFSSPSEHLSEDLRNKLLVAAIEVAEFNHVINAEPASRQWRWIFQTYTHWHSIVFLLLETSRRAWSPIVERAWVALHSCWLIPAQSKLDKNLRTWVPLRKLMTKSKAHRAAELQRLWSNRQAAERLELEDRKIPLPASSGPFPPEKSSELFLLQWRQLVMINEPISTRNPSATSPDARSDGSFIIEPAVDSPRGSTTGNSVSANENQRPWLAPSSAPIHGVNVVQPTGQGYPGTAAGIGSGVAVGGLGDVALTQDMPYGSFTTMPADWTGQQPGQSNFNAWQWADAEQPPEYFGDADINMDLEGGMDWYSWIESANKELE